MSGPELFDEETGDDDVNGVNGIWFVSGSDLESPPCRPTATSLCSQLKKRQRCTSTSSVSGRRV